MKRSSLKRRTPLRQRSTKRANDEIEYSRLRKAFLAKHTRCAVFPNERATQVHHSRGRIGRLLAMTEFWIPVSMLGHDWIERNHRAAREMRWNGIPLMSKPSEFNTAP